MLRAFRPLVTGALAALAVAFLNSAAPAQPPVIQEISWREFGLVIKASAPLDPEIFTLERPWRFVVDLPAAEFADTQLNQTIPVGKNGVKQVRMAQRGSSAVRLVVDCAGALDWQVMQLGDRSTLVIAPAGQKHAELAALLAGNDGYKGDGQTLQTIWAREDGEELRLHVRSEKPLTYSLLAADEHRIQLRVPRGYYMGLPPKTGKLLKDVSAKTGPDGTWTLELTLPEAPYQLAETREPAGKGLTLSWKRVDPHRFANRPLVVLDAGHGGTDPGAIGPTGVQEKAVTLTLARTLQQALVARRINAILTRTLDADLLLAPRLAMIDRYKADLFVSLHANSHTSADSLGIETYWREAPSQALANVVHKELTAVLKRPDRGVKQERLYVLRHPSVPSILLEGGFISNPIEEKLLADARFQAQAASAIVAGIERYMAAPPLAQAP